MNMKSRPFPLCAKWLALPALMACMTVSASAQLFWDPGVTGGPAGGSTTSVDNEWTTADVNNVWWNGVSNVDWTDSQNATFGGTAGTVRLGSNISAGTLDFDTAGYVIELNNVATSPRNLTLTGLTGEAATIRSSQPGANGSSSLTLSMAADTVWGGNIGSGGDRMNVTINGGNDLTVNQVIRSGGFSQTSLTINGAGTSLILSGTGSSYSGNFVNVNAGATFNLGANGNFSVRQLGLSATGTITATGTARIIDDNPNGSTNLEGFVTGTLGVQQSDTANAMTISNNGNTYSGGTYITAGEIIATADNALGTGVVQLTNTTGSTVLRMRSAAPVIGSLSSSGAGTKFLVLGNTAVNTNMTVNQTTAGTFGGVISQFAGQTGSLTKTGAEALTLSGANTYTGNTTISEGTLVLATTSESRFLIANSNVSNQINGTSGSILTANGLFRLDITGLTSTTGTWNLVDQTITDTYGANFNLAFVGGPTFSTSDFITYSSGDWSFVTTTGNLSLVPEPTSLALLAAGLGVMALRRRRH